MSVTKFATEQIHAQDAERITRIGDEADEGRKYFGLSEQRDYLNMKMKSMSRAKKTATLSIVRSMTTSWRRRLGRNLTNLRILRRRKVRSTDMPLPSISMPWKSPL